MLQINGNLSNTIPFDHFTLAIFILMQIVMYMGEKSIVNEKTN